MVRGFAESAGARDQVSSVGAPCVRWRVARGWDRRVTALADDRWRGRALCRSLSTNSGSCTSWSSPSTRRIPDFAERVRSETVYRHAGRYCIWSALVFVAALVFMFFTFSPRSPSGSSASSSCSSPGSSSPTTPGGWARRASTTSRGRCTPAASAIRSTIPVTGSVGASTATTDPPAGDVGPPVPRPAVRWHRPVPATAPPSAPGRPPSWPSTSAAPRWRPASSTRDGRILDRGRVPPRPARPIPTRSSMRWPTVVDRRAGRAPVAPDGLRGGVRWARWSPAARRCARSTSTGGATSPSATAWPTWSGCRWPSTTTPRPSPWARGGWARPGASATTWPWWCRPGSAAASCSTVGCSTGPAATPDTSATWSSSPTVGRARAAGGAASRRRRPGTAIAAMTGRPAAEADRAGAPAVRHPGRPGGGVGGQPARPAARGRGRFGGAGLRRRRSSTPPRRRSAAGAGSSSPGRPASSPAGLGADGPLVGAAAVGRRPPASAGTGGPSPASTEASGRPIGPRTRGARCRDARRRPATGRRRGGRCSGARPVVDRARGAAADGPARLVAHAAPPPASRPAPVGVPDGDGLRPAGRRAGPPATWSRSSSGAGRPPGAADRHARADTAWHRSPDGPSGQFPAVDRRPKLAARRPPRGGRSAPGRGAVADVADPSGARPQRHLRAAGHRVVASGGAAGPRHQGRARPRHRAGVPGRAGDRARAVGGPAGPVRQGPLQLPGGGQPPHGLRPGRRHVPVLRRRRRRTSTT